MDPSGHQGQTLEIVPISPSHLETLKLVNLIEMHNDEPALTKAELAGLS